MKRKRHRTRQRLSFPALGQLENELKRETDRRQYGRIFLYTVCVFITAAACAVLAAELWLPVLKVQGGSMSPALESGEVVLAVKVSEADPGDIIVFSSEGRTLIKRVIADGGDWVDIEKDGTVYVNGMELDEPYLAEKVRGDVDVKFPCQVPEGKLFVLGDHRSVSVDSRSSEVGFVEERQITGRLILRIWPLGKAGIIK